MTDTDPILEALAEQLGADAAEALLDRVDNYSNVPNAIKGMAKQPSDPTVEAAALSVVANPALADALYPTYSNGVSVTQECWGLVTLAARADVGVLDRWGAILEEDNDLKKLATIRRATAKHVAAVGQGDEVSGLAARPDAPDKVSQVKSWLANHPEADPTLLAPWEGQKAAARSAAVRGLGMIGTPQALETLGRYAQDSYPDAVLTELHRAWGNFDRRAFAATMFRQAPYTLDLGTAPSLEGIDAVPDLRSLDVVLTPRADLSPLAGCSQLRTLRVRACGLPGLIGVEPLLGLPDLTQLHLTETTRNADLTPLADLSIERMRLDLDGADGSFLLAMPRLRSLLLSGGSGPEDRVVATEVERRPAHPDLADVVVALVRRGVDVVVWHHEQSWVAGLVEQAEAAEGIAVLDAHGRVAITVDEARLVDLKSRMWGNRLP